MGTKRTKTYHQQLKATNISRLRDLLQELPSFCKDYFRGIEPTTTIKTRIGYAYDVRTFFRFLQSANPLFASEPVSEIELGYLVTVAHTYLRAHETKANLVCCLRLEKKQSGRGLTLRRISSCGVEDEGLV